MIKITKLEYCIWLITFENMKALNAISQLEANWLIERESTKLKFIAGA